MAVTKRACTASTSSWLGSSCCTTAYGPHTQASQRQVCKEVRFELSGYNASGSITGLTSCIVFTSMPVTHKFLIEGTHKDVPGTRE